MEDFVTIKIFDQSYTFKIGTDTERAREVVDFLVKEVTRVETQQKKQASGMTKLAILLAAALNITSEHVQLKQSYTSFLDTISMRSDKMLRQLNAITE